MLIPDLIYPKNKIDLFWFSKSKLQNKNILNFGDDINPYLIEKITGKTVQWQNPKHQKWWEKKWRPINFAIGSILHFATDNTNIWGSGLIDSKSKFPINANYFAIRGPISQQIIKDKGAEVPEIYGDPALLLPRFFEAPTKKYSLGIIPHYSEVEEVKNQLKEWPEDIKLIDLTGDVLMVLQEIASCEKIISSSLHGIIVGMAYDIPSLRIELSDKIYGDGIKYQDFYESVGIQNHRNISIDLMKLNLSDVMNLFKNDKDLRIQKELTNIQDQLLAHTPF